MPPVDATERPKGMAVVVMIPVVPALLNAIFDATGRRFWSLPVTQVMLKEVALAAAPNRRRSPSPSTAASYGPREVRDAI